MVSSRCLRSSALARSLGVLIAPSSRWGVVLVVVEFLEPVVPPDVQQVVVALRDLVELAHTDRVPTPLLGLDEQVVAPWCGGVTQEGHHGPSVHARGVGARQLADC